MSSGETRRQSNQQVKRRTFVQGLAAISAASLAGCQDSENQNGDDTSDETEGGGQQTEAAQSNGLGERVPTIEFGSLSNSSRTEAMDNAVPVIKEGFESLGLEFNNTRANIATIFGAFLGDKRTFHAMWTSRSPGPSRLDPHEFTRKYAADWAGNNGKGNWNNYANCEYTFPAVQQARAQSESNRRELVTEAHSIGSEDRYLIPLVGSIAVGGVRTDEVEVNALGKGGVTLTNSYFYIRSNPKNGNAFIANAPTTLTERTNYHTKTSSQNFGIWSHLVNSPLLEYNHENELSNALAEDIVTDNNGKRITVTLRDDALFQNGDPVTASDVKFTLEFLEEGNFNLVTSIPYDSIEVIDDKTVEINFTEVFAPYTTKFLPRWGILHEDSWSAAQGNGKPEDAEPDTVIGSGPYQMVSFESGGVMELEPFDGNPIHSPESNVIFQPFSSNQTAFQAFKQNEIQVISDVAPAVIEQINNTMSDVAQTAVTKGGLCISIEPNHPMAPMKFKEFRAAIGEVLNRRKMDELGFYGKAGTNMYCSVYNENHPWFPGEENVVKFGSETGDVDAARSILEDAGWRWDDDGFLRYPEGADLSPLWPKEGTPSPEDFPCLDELGS